MIAIPQRKRTAVEYDRSIYRMNALSCGIITLLNQPDLSFVDLVAIVQRRYRTSGRARSVLRCLASFFKASPATRELARTRGWISLAAIVRDSAEGYMEPLPAEEVSP